MIEEVIQQPNCNSTRQPVHSKINNCQIHLNVAAAVAAVQLVGTAGTATTIAKTLSGVPDDRIKVLDACNVSLHLLPQPLYTTF